MYCPQFQSGCINGRCWELLWGFHNLHACGPAFFSWLPGVGVTATPVERWTVMDPSEQPPPARLSTWTSSSKIRPFGRSTGPLQSQHEHESIMRHDKMAGTGPVAPRHSWCQYRYGRHILYSRDTSPLFNEASTCLQHIRHTNPKSQNARHKGAKHMGRLQGRCRVRPTQ